MINSDKIIGTVEWYQSEKGYGVIRDDNNVEYFIHCTNLSGNLKKLSSGMVVSFKSRPRPKNKMGLEANDLSLVEKDSKQPTTSVKPVFEVKAKTEQPKKTIEPQTIRSVVIALATPGINIYSAPRSRSAIQDNIENQALHAFRDDTIESWYSHFKTCHLSHLFQMSNGFITDRVKGVQFEGRQNVVAQLSVGEKLFLRREPQNPHDKNAIRVERVNGRQVGYVDRELASHLVYPYDRYGNPVPATVVELTGGIDSGTYRGVRIKFPIPGLVIE